MHSKVAVPCVGVQPVRTQDVFERAITSNSTELLPCAEQASVATDSRGGDSRPGHGDSPINDQTHAADCEGAGEASGMSNR